MTTIEQLCTDLAVASADYAVSDIGYGGSPEYMLARDIAEAAIVTAWNTALKAMQAMVRRHYRADNTGWGCSECRATNNYRPAIHTPKLCPVAACEAALAAMKGDAENANVNAIS